jgi:hypothetical protein
MKKYVKLFEEFVNENYNYMKVIKDTDLVIKKFDAKELFDLLKNKQGQKLELESGVLTTIYNGISTKASFHISYGNFEKYEMVTAQINTQDGTIGQFQTDGKTIIARASWQVIQDNPSFRTKLPKLLSVLVAKLKDLPIEDVVIEDETEA